MVTCDAWVCAFYSTEMFDPPRRTNISYILVQSYSTRAGKS